MFTSKELHSKIGRIVSFKVLLGKKCHVISPKLKSSLSVSSELEPSLESSKENSFTLSSNFMLNLSFKKSLLNALEFKLLIARGVQSHVFLMIIQIKI